MIQGSSLEVMASATPSETREGFTRPCTCHPDDKPPVPCAQKYALAECRVEALAEAMWQLLDDMRTPHESPCLAARAQARIAYEPFNDHKADPVMTMEEARRIMAESNY